MAIDVARELVRALEGKTFKNAVNMTPLHGRAPSQLEPYFGLSKKLGSMAAQLSRGGIASVEVTYSGELAELEIAPLTTALLQGILSLPYGEEVNMVNAGYLAKKRGIKVKESRGRIAGRLHKPYLCYHPLCKGSHQLAGSLFAPREVRIVQVEGYHVDVIPQGHFLVINHHDRPGVIGEVGTLLGQRGSISPLCRWAARSLAAML